MNYSLTNLACRSQWYTWEHGLLVTFAVTSPTANIPQYSPKAQSGRGGFYCPKHRIQSVFGWEKIACYCQWLDFYTTCIKLHFILFFRKIPGFLLGSFLINWSVNCQIIIFTDFMGLCKCIVNHIWRAAVGKYWSSSGLSNLKLATWTEYAVYQVEIFYG